jgi:hypothetical protein
MIERVALFAGAVYLALDRSTEQQDLLTNLQVLQCHRGREHDHEPPHHDKTRHDCHPC